MRQKNERQTVTTDFLHLTLNYNVGFFGLEFVLVWFFWFFFFPLRQFIGPDYSFFHSAVVNGVPIHFH